MQLVADKSEKISEPVKIRQEIIGGGNLSMKCSGPSL